MDKWIITDRRIIDIEQRGLFSREVSAISFRNLEDITVDTAGFFATILRYGTLAVQSAGAEPQFELPLATDPEKNKYFILEVKDRYIKDRDIKNKAAWRAKE